MVSIQGDSQGKVFGSWYHSLFKNKVIENTRLERERERDIKFINKKALLMVSIQGDSQGKVFGRWYYSLFKNKVIENTRLEREREWYN